MNGAPSSQEAVSSGGTGFQALTLHGPKIFIHVQCQDFIRGMLAYDPADRPSAADLLQHSFLAFYRPKGRHTAATTSFSLQAFSPSRELAGDAGDADASSEGEVCFGVCSNAGSCGEGRDIIPPMPLTFPRSSCAERSSTRQRRRLHSDEPRALYAAHPRRAQGRVQRQAQPSGRHGRHGARPGWVCRPDCSDHDWSCREPPGPRGARQIQRQGQQRRPGGWLRHAQRVGASALAYVVPSQVLSTSHVAPVRRKCDPWSNACFLGRARSGRHRHPPRRNSDALPELALPSTVPCPNLPVSLPAPAHQCSTAGLPFALPRQGEFPPGPAIFSTCDPNHFKIYKGNKCANRFSAMTWATLTKDSWSGCPPDTTPGSPPAGGTPAQSVWPGP